MSAPVITAERVRSLLAYDPQTGLITWRASRRGIAAGSVAGTRTSHGYVQISVDGRFYRAHRLAWLIVHGSFPDGEIDHINRNPSDNRLVNLRVVTRTVNLHNCGTRCDNKSGLTGVSWSRNRRKWVAQIQVNGATKYLGRFVTAEAARSAYLAAKTPFLPQP
jgi:hypothetical protein